MKRMGMYVALIMILGICYTGTVLFYSPYIKKSYVYNYPDTNLSAQVINNGINSDEKQAIDDFLRPLILSQPDLNNNSDIDILTNVINLIRYKKEYQLNGNMQIYSMDLVAKYALEYFNRANFNIHMSNNNFYYDASKNAFISYYNNQSNININSYEIKRQNDKIIADYEVSDISNNTFNYHFELSNSNNNWIILSTQ